MGVPAVPQYIADLYEEFKWAEHFGNHTPFEEMPGHKVDWWMRFMRLDEEVDATLRERNKSG